MNQIDQLGMEFIFAEIQKEGRFYTHKDNMVRPGVSEALDQLKAFGLIEKTAKFSYTLTEKGYNAKRLGSFQKWFEIQDKEPTHGINFYVSGNQNTFNQNVMNGSDANQILTPSNQPSTVEKASWWAGILSAIKAIFF
ncbi:hypothetical protein DYU11_15525 [Fibrisoma montanum]|uniref:Uncharacterized protein n=1 Tax=Fibrisoma montanum TaxID=2305895 RepID=A0A418M8K6_9BACT|nr:hypothetical protein [Fibrisoma montanum]RIV22424.1 hypothetical protein DYU11_15525 [Fibrisoma montanum]